MVGTIKVEAVVGKAYIIDIHNGFLVAHYGRSRNLYFHSFCKIYFVNAIATRCLHITIYF